MSEITPEVPDRRLTLIKRESSKPGLKGRINAKCIECIYDEKAAGEGGWRSQVEACTCKACPLYGVRPVSKRAAE